MLGRRALVGLIAAILGIAAIPAASYSTTTYGDEGKGCQSREPGEGAEGLQEGQVRRSTQQMRSRSDKEASGTSRCEDAL